MATDTLDGHLARSRNLVTDFGKLMDPLADKLFVGTAFVCLGPPGAPRVAVVIVILTREVAVSALRFVANRRGVVISASTLGKAKTALQAMTIASSSVGDPAHAASQLLVAAHDLRHHSVRDGLLLQLARTSSGEPASSPG